MCYKSHEILKKIIEECKSKGTYVLSEELELLLRPIYRDKIKKLKYIFVGDNPGKYEKKDELYFSENGHSGKNLHNFIDNFLEIKKDEFLLLNKSLIPSNSTAELEKLIEKGDDSQELVANFINELLNENKELFVCLLGVDYYGEKGIFSKFYTQLFKNKDFDKNRIGLYFHPSRRFPITNEQQDKVIKSKLPKEKVFKNYGIIMIEKYNKETLFEEALEKTKRETNSQNI